MRSTLVNLASIAVLIISGAAYADDAASESPASSGFVERAGQNALKEVALGKLAEKNARGSGVSALGSRLARDHGRMGAVLALICKDKGIPAPAELDSEHRAVVDRLSQLSGPEFDAAYAKLMASDHTSAIELFTQASQGEDPEFAEFARRTLPSLREHKRLADVYVKVTSDYVVAPVAQRN